uniref:Mitochondrial carrier protein n=1 Tax=Rhabditophanes sp. KR3021 TaxID=114890 RepID=A0AC35TPJ3_9BILA
MFANKRSLEFVNSFSNSREKTFSQQCIAGEMAGVGISLLMNPVKRVKCMMQVETGNLGVFGTINSIFEKEGFYSMYRGLGSLMVREIPLSAVFFPTYAFVTSVINPGNEKLSITATLIGGACTEIASWNNKIRDVAKFILKTEGPKGFFKGLFPVILRAIPFNIAYFVRYELALKALDEL